jgi:iron complex outermembrane receptor protein
MSSEVSLFGIYRSIFTWPQTTRNQAELLALNGRYDVTDHWIVQSNLYVRKFQQAHVDGAADADSLER